MAECESVGRRAEVRRFQLHLLNEKKLAPGTVEIRMSALRFFYRKTLKRRHVAGMEFILVD
jgi:hypothetical protein